MIPGKHCICVALALAGLCAALPLLGRGETPQVAPRDARAAYKEVEPLPARVIAQLGSDRLRRAEEFTSVAYSPDGSILASASRFGNVRLWDAADGSEKMLLRADRGGRDKGGSSVVFSPDGRLLAASDYSSEGGGGRCERSRLRGPSRSM
jgi:predicted amidohydrolase